MPKTNPPSEEKLEEHRKKKLLKEEMRKLARDRLAKKRRAIAKATRAKRIARVIPQAISEEDRVEVDPATKVLAKRKLQRRRLIEFISEFHPKYQAGWVHYDICAKLEKFMADVAAGKSPRLMILMPPRHGKSQIASKLFPAWLLGHHPGWEVMATSYNLSLALDFSREVRGVIRSEAYKQLFPHTKLSAEYQAAEAWKLQSETGVGAGGYIAAGIGGPITGKGAHVLIIDDPVKNAEEADSPEMREKNWNWYNSTAYTRLAPGGGVLIIQTWWHDDDLAGRVQQMMAEDSEADQFEIVKYPAIAEEDEEFRLKGEPLHPERYNLEQLLKIQRQLGGPAGRWWSALYQQNPVPQEGANFKASDFMWYTERPYLGNCHLYGSWDFAIGEKRTNDWTVGIIAAFDPDGRIWILHMERYRSSDQPRTADMIINMYQDWENVRLIAVEDGQIWKGVSSHFEAKKRSRNIYPTIMPLTPLTDKIIRAQPLQGMMQSHMVYFPKNAEWAGTMKKELLRFPGGIHDDMVDALAWLVRMILTQAPPARPKPPRSRAEKTVAEKVKALRTGGMGGSGHMAA